MASFPLRRYHIYIYRTDICGYMPSATMKLSSPFSHSKQFWDHHRRGRHKYRPGSYFVKIKIIFPNTVPMLPGLRSDVKQLLDFELFSASPPIGLSAVKSEVSGIVFPPAVCVGNWLFKPSVSGSYEDSIGSYMIQGFSSFFFPLQVSNY